MTPKRVLFVRTTNEVHRAADETATRLGLSLNAFCVEAILKAVEHHFPTPEGIETSVETKTPTQETGQGESQGQTQGGQETAERTASENND